MVVTCASASAPVPHSRMASPFLSGADTITVPPMTTRMTMAITPIRMRITRWGQTRFAKPRNNVKPTTQKLKETWGSEHLKSLVSSWSRETELISRAFTARFTGLNSGVFHRASAFFHGFPPARLGCGECR